MIVLILLVVAVGGIVEIVPLFFQRSTTQPVAGLKPLHRAAAGRPRHLHPRGLLQLPLADDPRPACRDAALRPLLDGRRVRLRPSVPVGQQAHRPRPAPGRRQVQRRVASHCTWTTRATSFPSRTCRPIRGCSRAKVDDASDRRPHDAACAASAFPTATTRSPRRRRACAARARSTRSSPTCRCSAPRSSDEEHRMDVNDLRIAVTLLSFVAFIGVVRLGLVATATEAVRAKRPACPSPTRSGAAMSDFFSSGWSVFIAVATVVSLVACLALLVFASRQQADGRRQQHRPRLRRRPGRDEQPDADVVGRPVRAHRRVRARLRLRVPGARQRRRQPRLDQPRRARGRPGAGRRARWPRSTPRTRRSRPRR